MICVVKDCGNEVHPERLAAIPLAKTCSSACSNEHQRELRRANNARRRERNKKEKIG